MKKFALVIGVILLACATALFCFMFSDKSETGTIKSDKIEVKTKISGQIVSLNIEEGAEIKKGEIIAQINPKIYQDEYDKASEELEKAQLELKISKKDIAKINNLITHTKHDIKTAKQMLESANDDYVIYKNAYKDGSVTGKDMDNALKNLETARKYYDTAQKNLKLVSEELNSTVSKKTSQDKQIEKLMGELEQAELNLSYTTIVSPVNGIIKDKKVEPSKEVQKDDVIAVIKSKEYYVLAPMKAPDIKKGQPVTIILKGKNIKGMVDEIDGNTVKINFLEDVSGYKLSNGKKVKIHLSL